MRSLWLALALLIGLTVGACAQGCGAANPNCVVPTAPAGNATNRAASTAFVGTALTNLLGTANIWTAIQTYSAGIDITATTATSSPTTGALVLSGGIGTIGGLYAGGNASWFGQSTNANTAVMFQGAASGTGGGVTVLWQLGGTTNVLALGNISGVLGGSYNSDGLIYSANPLHLRGNANSTDALLLNAGVQVGAPTGGDKGAGTLNIAGTIWTNGTQGLATRTCTVDQALTLIFTNGILTGGTCTS